MQHDIAIAIVAYNRPLSLDRLLQSLDKADYEGYSEVPLYIHIDHADDDAVLNIARQFSWKFGPIQIHQHQQNVGLKQNVMYSGALSQQHQAVIVFEDDLLVSPAFYQYAQQAYSFFKDDTNVAGIALYANTFNEVAYCTFDPMDDGYDNYFMQVPCSWGQLWTSSQWKSYTDYLALDRDSTNKANLPDSVASWPDESSWKKQFYRYLLDTNKYFAYPRVGLTTNFAESGKHIAATVSVFQTSLLLRTKKFNFIPWDRSFVIYDGYFEWSGLGFNRYTGMQLDVCFDINMTKNLDELTSTYIISARQSQHPIAMYAASCYPYETNVLLGLKKQANQTDYLTLSLLKDVTDQISFNRKEADLCRCMISKAHAQSIIGLPAPSLFQRLKNSIKK